MSQKGITPRNEDIPLTIDAQYVAGFNWARQPGLARDQEFWRRRLVRGVGRNAANDGLPGGFTPGSCGAATPVNAVNGNGVICNTLGRPAARACWTATTTIR